MAESSRSYDRFEEPLARTSPAGRVLWGRVVALTGVVILAFLIGRWTAPTTTARDELQQLRVRLEEERSRADALQKQLSSPFPSPSVSPTSSPAPAEGQSYVVQAGDTLGSIALKFYGDSSLAHLIAEANGIQDVRTLRPGRKLVIPPKPSG